ncbi:MAG: HIT family hydrolase [bacterium]|nr:HIT family hydrolase [bacterium]
MTEIIDINGSKHKVKCIACAIQGGKISLPVERIAETENFVLEQDLEWPIEGFIVIVSKRHIVSIDELTDREMEELAKFMKIARVALRKILGISAVTLVQEESSTTSHFHFWLFPWHDWMKENWNGKLYEIKDIMKYAKQKFLGKENLERIKQCVLRLREEI